MKIHLGDYTYIAERDSSGWSLQSPYDSKDKDGNPKITYKTTYYGKFSHVMQAIQDRAVGKCQTFEEVLELLQKLDSKFSNVEPETLTARPKEKRKRPARS